MKLKNKIMENKTTNSYEKLFEQANKHINHIRWIILIGFSLIIIELLL